MIVDITATQIKEMTLPHFTPKDKLSALTHFIGFILSIIATPFLLIKGAMDNRGLLQLISYAIFSLSMVMLYGASTSYHSFNLGKERNKKLRKLDHIMISVLIAGTYTPLCVGTLYNNNGILLLVIIWALATLSIIFNLYWITCPKWISSLIYISMGWACVPYISTLYSLLPKKGFLFLLLGGIVYTLGGVLYAIKLPIMERNKEFRSHELFHIFIMVGTLFHFLMVYLYVA